MKLVCIEKRLYINPSKIVAIKEDSTSGIICIILEGNIKIFPSNGMDLDIIIDRIGAVKI